MTESSDREAAVAQMTGKEIQEKVDNGCQDSVNTTPSELQYSDGQSTETLSDAPSPLSNVQPPSSQPPPTFVQPTSLPGSNVPSPLSNASVLPPVQPPFTALEQPNLLENVDDAPPRGQVVKKKGRFTVLQEAPPNNLLQEARLQNASVGQDIGLAQPSVVSRANSAATQVQKGRFTISVDSEPNSVASMPAQIPTSSAPQGTQPLSSTGQPLQQVHHQHGPPTVPLQQSLLSAGQSLQQVHHQPGPPTVPLQHSLLSAGQPLQQVHHHPGPTTVPLQQPLHHQAGPATVPLQQPLHHQAGPGPASLPLQQPGQPLQQVHHQAGPASLPLQQPLAAPKKMGRFVVTSASARSISSNDGMPLQPLEPSVASSNVPLAPPDPSIPVQVTTISPPLPIEPLGQPPPGGVPLQAPVPPAAALEPEKPAVLPPKPATQPVKNRVAGKPPAFFDSKGVGSTMGLGKVFYFLEQMKCEVSEADRSIKSLHKEVKFLKEKNKELEAKSRDMEKRWQEEKVNREAAETKARQWRRKLKELKEEIAAGKDCKEVVKDVLQQEVLEGNEKAIENGILIVPSSSGDALDKDQPATIAGEPAAPAETPVEGSPTAPIVADERATISASFSGSASSTPTKTFRKTDDGSTTPSQQRRKMSNETDKRTLAEVAAGSVQNNRPPMASQPTNAMRQKPMGDMNHTRHKSTSALTGYGYVENGLSTDQNYGNLSTPSLQHMTGSNGYMNGNGMHAGTMAPMQPQQSMMNMPQNQMMWSQGGQHYPGMMQQVPMMQQAQAQAGMQQQTMQQQQQGMQQQQQQLAQQQLQLPAMTQQQQQSMMSQQQALSNMNQPQQNQMMQQQSCIPQQSYLPQQLQTIPQQPQMVNGSLGQQQTPFPQFTQHSARQWS